MRSASWDRDEALLREIRQRVFIEEQGVPENLEWDTDDHKAAHFLALDANGAAVGCARLLPDGHCGRMAVLAHWRRQGIGGALLGAVATAAGERGLGTLKLSAQQHAIEFYKRYGFETVGDTFLEAGIVHIAMQKKLRLNG